jgi:hypothetical protein
MSKKTEEKRFRTLEEYKFYFQCQPVLEEKKGSKYYRMGVDIARMGCRDVGSSLSNAAS